MVLGPETSIQVRATKEKEKGMIGNLLIAAVVISLLDMAC